MSNTLYIQNFVRIFNNKLFVNNRLLLEQEGNTDAFARALYQDCALQYPKFFKMDLMSKMGLVASSYILHDMGDIDMYKRCFIFQNKSASLIADKAYDNSIDTHPSPLLFVYTLPNIVMGELAIKFRFKGENTFFVLPNFNAAQLVEYTNILFKQQIAQYILLGFIEVTETTQNILFASCSEKKSNCILDIEELQSIFDKTHTN
ncbi:MAG: hypothetical protein R2831_11665 [Chitinophagaceae bacterium]